MKKSEQDLLNPFYQQIVENLRKIMNERGITQETMAFYGEIDNSAMSKIFNYTQRMTFGVLSKISKGIGMKEIDVITYPEVFRPESKSTDPIEAILQIRLRKDKKDQVLRLIFGDNNIEILNK